MPTPSRIIISSSTAWAKLDAELAGFPGKLNSARYQAVKRTADQGRRMIADRFIEQYPKIQRSKIESGDPTKRARPIVSRVSKGKDPEGFIVVTEQPIPMIAFRPTGPGMGKFVKQKRVAYGGGDDIVFRKLSGARKVGGITVTMGRGRPPLHLRHAFRAIMPSGHEGIFLRKKKGGAKRLVVTHGTAAIQGGIVSRRLPIQELFGPNVYSLMNVPKVNAEVVAKLDGLLAKNIQGQIDRFLKPKA